MGEVVEMAIVGGGMSGMCMGMQLLQAGRRSFVVLEKQGQLGGTWSVNRYPGCSCDVPAHLYSFSFLPHPSWTRLYAHRAQICHYLHLCARRCGLLPYIRLHTHVLSASWDASASLWRLLLQTLLPPPSSSSSSSPPSPYTISARFLVRAVGALHEPIFPAIPSIPRFAGRSFHSSAWDSSVHLHDKKVAVIGTGASSIQIVPEIAPIVKELYVFQRTPAWILPKADVGIPRIWQCIFEKVPLMMGLFRGLLFLTHELMVWAFLGCGKGIRRVGEGLAKRHMHKAIKDPDMRARLTPKYAMGCKRVLLSSKFYPALGRPNVKLVTEPIQEIQEQGLLLSADSHGGIRSIDVDIIIYATGFDLLHPKFPVVGRSGVRLSQASPTSFLGTTKHGFPNFFMLLGPNTGVGHTSQLLMIEAQVRYILSCLRMVTPPYTCSLELRGSSESRYQQLLARRFPNTVWTSGGCTSWYLDPTTRHNPVIWPASTIEYIYRSWSANPLDYTLQ